MNVQVAYAAWLDLTVELVTAPGSAFPHTLLLGELSDSFQSLSSWHFQEVGGSFSFDLSHPVPGLPDVELETWAHYNQTLHPLLCWFQATLDPRPMTVDRVPRELVPQEGFAIVHELCAPLGIDRQLSIPYQLTPDIARAFVLAQTGQDFTDEDVALARLLQPLIALVGRQSDVLARATTDGEDPVGLTGRERAVLQLLSEGFTARGMASSLAISPRTVHSHLAHVYDKLGVTDRLCAVTRAGQLGLLRGAGDPLPEERPSQVVYEAPKDRLPPLTTRSDQRPSNSMTARTPHAGGSS